MGPPETVCEGGCLPSLAWGPQYQAIIKTGGRIECFPALHTLSHRSPPRWHSPDKGEVDLSVGRVVLQLDQENEQQGTQKVDQGDDPRGKVLEQQKQGLLWGEAGKGVPWAGGPPAACPSPTTPSSVALRQGHLGAARLFPVTAWRWGDSQRQSQSDLVVTLGKLL